jgi:hypothetical protein
MPGDDIVIIFAGEYHPKSPYDPHKLLTYVPVEIVNLPPGTSDVESTNFHPVAELGMHVFPDAIQFPLHLLLQLSPIAPVQKGVRQNEEHNWQLKDRSNVQTIMKTTNKFNLIIYL